MKKFLGAALVACMAASGTAAAEVSTTLTLTTDYVFRGLSQTDGGAAVQGSFDYTNGVFYAGVWGSNVNYGATSPSETASMELDAYIGLTPTTGPIEWDLSFLGYFYPNADDEIAGGEMDYWEAIAAASHTFGERLTLGGQVSYSDEYFGEVGSAFYYELNGSYAFNDAVSMSGAWGVQTFDDNALAGDDWDTWNLGGSYAAHGFTIDLRYHDTDISGVDSIVNLSISRGL